MPVPTQKIVIIGGGSAGLMVAALLHAHHEVHLYERGKMLGRKFLVAGKGGFNLTNQATGTALYDAYTSHPIIQQALRAFGTQSQRNWLQSLGIPTYVGSSGRVFPEQGIKPIEVLQALRQRLQDRGVQIHLHHEWRGLNMAGQLHFDHQGATVGVDADAVILALGGASWSKTGSDGAWLPSLEALGVPLQPFAPSNCGVNVAWPEAFTKQFAGTPLKNIALRVGEQVQKGEVLITEYGLEGNALYPLVPALRQDLKTESSTSLIINLKPYSSLDKLQKKITEQRTKTKNYLYTLRISKAALALAKQYTTKAEYMQALEFAKAIQQLSIPIKGLRPIEEAISTVGGVDLEGLTPNFELRTRPKWYAIGEMLDWDAPTGGFLLQGCFSTAAVCAHHLNEQIPL